LAIYADNAVAGLHYAARLDRSCMTTCIDEVIVDQLE
jgi:hypothetical protein